MANEILKEFVRQSGHKLYEFADMVGLSESWFYHCIKREMPEQVQRSLVEGLKKTALGEQPDLSAWNEYRVRQEALAQARRNDSHRKRAANIKAWRKINAALDEAEERRIKGGWDTWQ